MFCSTFRNTVKTLFRSATFWLVFTVFAVIMIRYGIVDHVTYAPGFEPPPQISYNQYASAVDNAIHAGSLIYPLAILVVIATVLVLNRDYGDSFYEIEKAADVKPSRYLFGRLSAVVAITFAAQWVLTFAAMHMNVLKRGGVEGLSTLQYIGDSLFRITRTNLCIALPHILFYVGITYLIGAIFKNGIVAAVGGFANAIAFYVINYIYHNALWSKTYLDYFSPMPEKLRHYFAYVGLDTEEMMFGMFDTSLGKAMACIAFLVGVFAVCTVIAYARIRKRET